MNFPAESARLGNLLAIWFWTYQRREQGVRAFVARTEHMDPWLDVFPALREFVLERSAIPFTAHRSHEMPLGFEEERRSALETFIRTYLLTSPLWPESPLNEPYAVTVNVRRGDYYSDPRWRALYGFNVAAYVKVALDGCREQADINTVRVVSDEPQWCQENLRLLEDYGTLEFQDPSDGPVENLLQLSSASRLVLANSTFSYWAGYMSNVWHSGGHGTTWAPWLHRRDFFDGAAWQLDPRWCVVRDIPGRW